MKNVIIAVLLVAVSLFVSGCAEISKRDMADHGAQESPLYLTQCSKPQGVAFERISLADFAQYGGAELVAAQSSIDVMVQKALSRAGCAGATPQYRVRVSFDVTGKMMGSLCGQQVGGFYGVVMGSYGGRCVNFSTAKVVFTVFDLRAKKDVLTVAAQTDASSADEISGSRFLKGIREDMNGNDGGLSRTPEGRIVAELMRKGLEALNRDLSQMGASAAGKAKALSSVQSLSVPG